MVCEDEVDLRRLPENGQPVTKNPNSSVSLNWNYLVPTKEAIKECINKQDT